MVGYGAVETGRYSGDGSLAQKIYEWTGTNMTSDGQPLKDIDGNDITLSGWYNFARKYDPDTNTYSGIGVEPVLNTRKVVVALKYYFKDNIFGDKEPETNRIVH